MSQGFGPNSPFGRFSPINQGPTGMPTAPAVDPPGYYLGWPLANAGKRLGASLIDWVGFWVIAWFVMVVVWGALASAGGEAVGQTAVFPLLIVIYALGYYNVGLQQSRTGQSWGKRFLGLRLVKMNELRPPSKFDLTFRPIIGVFEMLTGVGILSMLLSRYRQSFGDRFAGTVVIDESRAGMTLPWVLPTDPVVAPGPPQPQGGVPRPAKPRVSGRFDLGALWRQARSAQAQWAQAPRPGPQPPPGPQFRPTPPPVHDLPEREYGDVAPPRTGPRTPSGAEFPAPGERVERDDPNKLDIPPRNDGPQTQPSPPPPGAPAPEPAPPPRPSPASLPRGGKRYLTDPRIVKAIRAEDPASAHRLAKACIDAAFERRETVDVEDAVAEYKALITSQGVPIRSSDDTVASWLGLG